MSTISIPIDALTAITLIEKTGGEAWIVGGYVREAIRKTDRQPTDIVIATSLLPEEIAQLFENQGYHVFKTGIQHGTVTALVNSRPIEITTYRTDNAYTDHRHPNEVTFLKNIEEDLARRDFTINAMAYHPARGLLDPFGGQADLRAGLIKTVGDPHSRFNEDALRILRALRFSVQPGFSIESRTANSMYALKDSLLSLSAERVQQELRKLIVGQSAPEVLRAHSSIVGVVIPEILPCVGFNQHSPYHCFDVWEHTLQALDPAPRDEILRLAILFHDLGKPKTCRTDADGRGHFHGHAEESQAIAEDILRRLKFPRTEVREISTLVLLHDYQIPLNKRAVKQILRQLKGNTETFKRLLILKYCDAMAHAPGHRERAEDVITLRNLYNEILASGEAYDLHQLAINGKNILDLGVKPGPQINTILEQALDAVVNGHVPNEKQALKDYVQRIQQNAGNF